ncbi:hypothetical protein PHYPO_G00014120 [Pangasianodon hypophthalmus]|uniref:Uncharacterized protein n=1 Tax=Pangasianodon hypophthalmus TaxID=310915 RepID=A0A5N5N407_PANHP|nr:hypothetical protein PHYPO_G00014120 [Pangasianodon hypophthalmus]
MLIQEALRARFLSACRCCLREPPLHTGPALRRRAHAKETLYIRKKTQLKAHIYNNLQVGKTSMKKGDSDMDSLSRERD